MNRCKFLFWNIRGNKNAKIICDYAFKYKIDVLILIEDEIPPTKMLLTLNAKGVIYRFCGKNERGISIYTTISDKLFTKINTDSKYITLFEFKLFRKNLLIGGVHLPSKLKGASESARAFPIQSIKRAIEKIEAEKKHSNTILMGDFNMHPFELGMVKPEGFNAVMCREIAGNVTRPVTGLGSGKAEQFSYFYNPMWSFLGDISKYKPGTYYFHSNEYDNHYRWSMIDQLLIRPSIIGNFVSDSLEIIDKDISGKDILNIKKRNAIQISDHLPVYFELDITK